MFAKITKWIPLAPCPHKQLPHWIIGIAVAAAFPAAAQPQERTTEAVAPAGFTNILDICPSAATSLGQCLSNASKNGARIFIPDLPNDKPYELSSTATIDASDVQIVADPASRIRANLSSAALKLTGSGISVENVTIDNQNNILSGYGNGVVYVSGSQVKLRRLSVLHVPANPNASASITLTGSNIEIDTPLLPASGLLLIYPPAHDISISGGQLGTLEATILKKGGKISRVTVSNVKLSAASGYQSTCISIGDYSAGIIGSATSINFSNIQCNVVSPNPVVVIRNIQVSHGILRANGANNYAAGEEVRVEANSVGRKYSVLGTVLTAGLDQSGFSLGGLSAPQDFRADSGTADDRAFGAATVPSPTVAQFTITKSKFYSIRQYISYTLFEFGCSQCDFSNNEIDFSSIGNDPNTVIVHYGRDSSVSKNVFNLDIPNGDRSEAIRLYPQRGDNVPMSGDNMIISENIIRSSSPIYSAIDDSCNHDAPSSSQNITISNNTLLGLYERPVIVTNNGHSTCKMSGFMKGNNIQASGNALTFHVAGANHDPSRSEDGTLTW